VTSWDPETQATLHSRQSRRAAGSPSARTVALCAAAVVTALASAAAARSAAVERLQAPQFSEIARGGAAIPDKQLSGKAANITLPAGSWGGAYTTPTGERVTVYASAAYPQDPAIGQRWANFLATLVHGSELSSVTVFLAPSFQVDRFCGSDAVACYSSQDDLLIAPGDDPSSDLSAEAVVTHEYGHHVAAHRFNAPWDAVDYGTKRWASVMQVCAGARKGDFAPGAEDPVRYDVNPGEGFAESYRVLNERKAGRVETAWEIVARSLYPSDVALAALDQDVVSPWTAGTTTATSARFTRKLHTRNSTFATPLDGTLRVTVRPSAGTRVAVDVFAAGTRVIHATGGAVNRTTTVCGARTYRVRVHATKGNGSFTLAVAKP
jgi:hypothetical protein